MLVYISWLLILLLGSTIAVRAASDNSPEWIRQFGTAQDEAVNGIAVDSFGNVYSIGYTTGLMAGKGMQGDGDIFVSKRGSDGEVEWTRQFGGGFGETNFGSRKFIVGAIRQGTNVCVDGDDDVYVSADVVDFGRDSIAEGGAILIKLSPAGDVIWQRSLGAESTRPDSIACASRRNYHYAHDTNPSTSSSSTPSASDMTAVAHSSSSESHVADDVGAGIGSDKSARADLTDFLNHLWQGLSALPSASLSSTHAASSLETSAVPAVYVAGSTGAGFDGQASSSSAGDDGFDDLFLSKLDARTGQTLWTVIHASGKTSTESVDGVATDQLGNIYVAGTSTVHRPVTSSLLSKSSAAGTAAMGGAEPETETGARSDPGTAALGFSASPHHSSRQQQQFEQFEHVAQTVLWKFDDTGRRLWEARVDAGHTPGSAARAVDLAVGLDGSVYFGGRVSAHSSSQGAIRSSSGSDEMDSVSRIRHLTIHSAAADEANSEDAHGGSAGQFVVKLNLDGEMLWSQMVCTEAEIATPTTTDSDHHHTQQQQKACQGVLRLEVDAAADRIVVAMETEVSFDSSSGRRESTRGASDTAAGDGDGTAAGYKYYSGHGSDGQQVLPPKQWRQQTDLSLPLSPQAVRVVVLQGAGGATLDSQVLTSDAPVASLTALALGPAAQLQVGMSSSNHDQSSADGTRPIYLGGAVQGGVWREADSDSDSQHHSAVDFDSKGSYDYAGGKDAIVLKVTVPSGSSSSSSTSRVQQVPQMARSDTHVASDPSATRSPPSSHSTAPHGSPAISTHHRTSHMSSSSSSLPATSAASTGRESREEGEEQQGARLAASTNPSSSTNNARTGSSPGGRRARLQQAQSSGKSGSTATSRHSATRGATTAATTAADAATSTTAATMLPRVTRSAVPQEPNRGASTAPIHSSALTSSTRPSIDTEGTTSDTPLSANKLSNVASSAGNVVSGEHPHPQTRSNEPGGGTAGNRKFAGGAAAVTPPAGASAAHRQQRRLMAVSGVPTAAAASTTAAAATIPSVSNVATSSAIGKILEVTAGAGARSGAARGPATTGSRTATSVRSSRRRALLVAGTSKEEERHQRRSKGSSLRSQRLRGR